MLGAFAPRVCTVLLVLAHVLSAQSPNALLAVTATSVQDRTVASLEQYQRGEFETAVDRLLNSRQVRSVVGEFRSTAGAWIDRAPASEKHARTLVASAMAVEVMAASFVQHFFDYQSGRELIEWSCSRLKKFPPVDSERWIHLSFIALAQGARDDSILTGVKRPLAVVSMPTTGSHATHAGLRFPNEGRFKLALVTGRWEAHQIASFPLTPAYLNRLTYGRFAVDEGESQIIEGTLRLLEALFGDWGVGSEARLRSGVLKFLRERPDAAKEDLQYADAAEDPAVRSLAHLMLGTIADRAGDNGEALRRFRLAHNTLASSTTSLALAGRLFRSGLTEDATSVLRAFDAAPPGPDPWDLYGQRDFRFFSAYREQMRRGVVR